MKTILYINLLAMALCSASCSKYDNYPEPEETLMGQVTEAVTGDPLQTEAGGNGVRVKLEELSWSDNPTPYYFYTKQDGSFNNTKIFKGNYRISVEGPFVPLVQQDEDGKVIVDNSITTDIGGTKEVDFTVEPFLKVTWMGEPVYDADTKTVSVQVKVARGTDHADFQQKVTDIFLFVNALPYVANNNYDNRYSTQLTYDGAAEAPLGETITLTSTAELPENRTFYLRVGARTDYGLKYYNYTDVKAIDIP